MFGVIAFYLAHEQDVDANMSEGEEDLRRSVAPLSESRPELYARLERARYEVTAAIVNDGGVSAVGKKPADVPPPSL